MRRSRCFRRRAVSSGAGQGGFQRRKTPIIACDRSGYNCGTNRILRAIRSRWRRRRLRRKTPKEIFTETFRHRLWRGRSSASGYGSAPENTRALVEQLRPFLDRWQVKSLADVPCGDFAWMREVDLNGLRYLGGDIVTALVERNRAMFSRPGIEFTEHDFIRDPLPDVDLLLCRDGLVHLCFRDLAPAIDNIRNSGIPYFPGIPVPTETERVRSGYIHGRWKSRVQKG